MKIIFSGLVFYALIMQAHAELSLTIYNQKFGVVRDTVPLDLRQGVNEVRFAGATAFLEPDSIILRDPKSAVKLSILEQNYRADSVSTGLLLDLNVGKEIEFFVKESNKPDRIVKGKVIRSGYVPHPEQVSRAQDVSPLIEVDGMLQFSLPGEPRFPALDDDAILKPTLDWRIHSDKDARFDAELSYVTQGMSWDASYNLVAPEKGDVIEFIGWVTVANQSGKTFKDARLQLIAGDVAKLHDAQAGAFGAAAPFFERGAPKVTEQTFDEFHLYSLPLPTTLHDRETKQVEFVRAAGVKAKRLYIYDGSSLGVGTVFDRSYRDTPQYGTTSNPKVWVMREIENSQANQMGLPLPKGKVRFYRQDTDGSLQFTGEDLIDHTAAGETLRLYTGNAFDLVGERRQVSHEMDPSGQITDEIFEIKVRNRKKDEAVEIRVVEHLFRWNKWEIRGNNAEFKKTDAETIEFRVTLKPGEERVINYTAHYNREVLGQPGLPATSDDPSRPPPMATDPFGPTTPPTKGATKGPPP